MAFQDEETDLTPVDQFFLGALEWDQLSSNDQRVVRDALKAEEEYDLD